MLATINLTVRFLLELCALAALAYWGLRAVPGPWRFGLAVVAPLLFALAWGLFASPKARFKRELPGQLLIEALLFGVAVAALAAAGEPLLALIFAAVTLLNRVAITLLGQSTGG